PGPYATGYALQPANDTLMSRAQGRFGQVTLGAIVGARRYNDPAGGNAGENDVAGADAQWLITDNLRLKAQAMGSSTTAFDDGNGVLRRGAAQRGGMAYLG